MALTLRGYAPVKALWVWEFEVGPAKVWPRAQRACAHARARHAPGWAGGGGRNDRAPSSGAGRGRGARQLIAMASSRASFVPTRMKQHLFIGCLREFSIIIPSANRGSRGKWNFRPINQFIVFSAACRPCGRLPARNPACGGPRGVSSPLPCVGVAPHFAGLGEFYGASDDRSRLGVACRRVRDGDRALRQEPRSALCSPPGWNHSAPSRAAPVRSPL